jgi:hypothetical protein
MVPDCVLLRKNSEWRSTAFRHNNVPDSRCSSFERSELCVSFVKRSFSKWPDNPFKFHPVCLLLFCSLIIYAIKCFISRLLLIHILLPFYATFPCTIILYTDVFLLSHNQLRAYCVELTFRLVIYNIVHNILVLKSQTKTIPVYLGSNVNITHKYGGYKQSVSGDI